MIEYIQNTAQKPAANGARKPEGGNETNLHSIGMTEEEGSFAGTLMSVIRRFTGFRSGSGETLSTSESGGNTEAEADAALDQQNAAPLNLPNELKLLSSESPENSHMISPLEPKKDQASPAGVLSASDTADLSGAMESSKVVQEVNSVFSEQTQDPMTTAGARSQVSIALEEAARAFTGIQIADSAELKSPDVQNKAFAFTGRAVQPAAGVHLYTSNAPLSTSESVKTISTVLKGGFKDQKSEPSPNQSISPTQYGTEKVGDEITPVKETERAVQSLVARRTEAFQPVQENGPVLQNSKTVTPDIFKEVAKAAGINTGELQRTADTRTVEQGFETILSTTRPEMSQRSEADVQLVRKIQQVVKQEIQPNLNADKAWKLHNFSLHDGSRVQLAFRQLEGVLQLQLSSVNQDLNRLIQMNVQEIRDYLQNEMGLDIDLQFDENRFSSGEEMNNDESSGSGNTQAGSSENRPSSRVFAEEAVAGRARFFGFNDNEWTA
ncbi:hypothetical protein [Rhodohalobacter mucosus]|uniref:Flagellar hook-length control protein FliK n=1 Tax=Rhodohalobacter mucosus TaxID=2079485 RepID=A0A316TN29_9BACT|nr:hypothetical protein [Rhodohalobacter mucosus]PWN05178.1 hypothetical protein DDZ15_15755 [Rhodohalobacter mucosus]